MPGDHAADIVRRLYEAPPDGFVAARTAAVAAARQAGDREAAKRYAALRKPTVAAWLVNLLALRRPDLVDELVELSAALRSAQRDLHGDQLRELSTQRRRMVSALVSVARDLALAQDPALSGAKLPLAEVETTLTAALSEPEIAAQVRSGRLVRAATYAGFGEVPRPRLRLITADDLPEAPEDSAEDSAPEDGEVEDGAAAAADAQRRRDLTRELTAAQAAERQAHAALERAAAAERDAVHALERIEAELAELDRRRAAAQAEVSGRTLARRSAERDTAAARRRVGDAQAAIEDLELRGPE
ncbi:hypothetical protein EV385_2027 [Krasilnikovia cinnamomea]|uniref:Uncharacterized protein n=1 Tax=Krasilnikovia cinnamomea TaxID=349313 RepID=A0A4Q7ZHF0_9ACTN|nr:hypothetical protein [Krasilnikovia cinnamomea]RZU50260.1 hypothetical protein EV385_2027 [Krasilnikovia cinnamomea]